jgi:hypothetical protein
MRKGMMILAAVVLLGGAGFVACGSSDSTTTHNPDLGAGTGGTGGSGGSGGTGGSDGGGATDGSAEAGAPAACVQGTAASHMDLINACPAAGVYFEDKVVTLPGGLKVGEKLPDLM